MRGWFYGHGRAEGVSKVLCKEGVGPLGSELEINRRTNSVTGV